MLQLKEEKLPLLWGLVTIDQTLVLIQFVTGEQKYLKNSNICNYLKINNKSNENDNNWINNNNNNDNKNNNNN